MLIDFGFGIAILQYLLAPLHQWMHAAPVGSTHFNIIKLNQKS